jgi:NADH dehydrogenase/NADH:ubiquinone oxidoreductase subunit G
MQMGCLPDRGPGLAEPSKKGKGYHEMKSGMKTLYIAGTVPDVDFKSDFLIIQASHMTTLTEKADLVLPATVLYEKQGTIINTYGKQRSIAEAEKPAGEAQDGVDIAALISSVMNEAKSFKARDIVASAKKVKPGKPGVGSFKTVTPKARQPYAV